MSITRLFATLLVTLSLVLSCGGSPTEAPPQTEPVLRAIPPRPGNYTISFNMGPVPRRFVISIPPGYTPGTAVPLVLVFHGFRGTAQSGMSGTGIDREADSRGWVSVFGEGVGLANAGGWNALFCCGAAHSEMIDDIAYVTTILSMAQSTLSIDPRRIYATGYSNGAMFTHRLGVELGNRLAAIAPVAGALSGISNGGTTRTPVPTPQRQIPVLSIHGQSDPTVPYNGGSDGATTFDSEETSMGFWAMNNGCNPVPTITQVSPHVSSYNYLNCANGTQVRHLSVRDGVHRYMLLEVDQAITPRVVLDFLQQFTLP